MRRFIDNCKAGRKRLGTQSDIECAGGVLRKGLRDLEEGRPSESSRKHSREGSIMTSDAVYNEDRYPI